MELLHEGKAKQVFADPKSKKNVVIDFTDNVTAGNGKKKETIKGKGKLACDLSEFFFKYLGKKGIDTHLVKRLDDTQMRCKKVDILPLEVVCRNIAAGSFCKRYGVKKGTELASPLIEFFLKEDKLHDPLITEDAALRLDFVNESELAFLKSVALSVNYYLSELFKQVDLTLVDFKLEFGKTPAGTLLLADEISGDTIRVWNSKGKSYDKDLFRKGEGNITTAYAFLLEKLNETKPNKIDLREEILFVSVMPKDGIKNPPGEVTKKALVRLGFGEATEVRMGKIFEIHLSKPITSDLLNQLTLMNLKLLSNPIAEKHKVRMEM
ncbi:MAG: phosphoribosylaminoimidazolesuccinocarboxamide synthase [Candidatus Thorarchaeota archaeon]|jgi:phosphoribosylaminoimidazole-succinocarboxamide synthase/phosphoribosylformylglycinamidine synthase PurS subunit